MSEVQIKPLGWRYEIQHGPEGEANYAWVYCGTEMVATMRTHHAMEVVSVLSGMVKPENVARGMVDAGMFSDEKEARREIAMAEFMGNRPAPPVSDLREENERKLIDELKGVVRILDAVKYQVGLGKTQIDRMHSAKALLDALQTEGK